MEIYEVTVDRERAQEIAIPSLDHRPGGPPAFAMRPPLGPQWQTPTDGVIVDPSRPRAAFYAYKHELVVGPEIYDEDPEVEMLALLQTVGETLPVQVGGQLLLIANVLEMFNAHVPEKSEWGEIETPTGLQRVVAKPCLRASRLGTSLFRVHGLEGRLFCTDYLGPRPFKDRYEEMGYTGLKFEPVLVE